VSTSDPDDAGLRSFLADPAHLTLDLRTATARCVKALGLRHAVVYLVDLQQRHLVPQTAVAPSVPVDGSPAGWAYRTQSLRAAASPPGSRCWTARSGSACWPCARRPSPPPR